MAGAKRCDRRVLLLPPLSRSLARRRRNHGEESDAAVLYEGRRARDRVGSSVGGLPAPANFGKWAEDAILGPYSNPKRLALVGFMWMAYDFGPYGFF